MNEKPEVKIEPIEEPKKAERLDGDPTWCRQCSGNTKMIDSREAFTEHWECLGCGAINVMILPDNYKGGIPETMQFENIIY